MTMSMFNLDKRASTDVETLRAQNRNKRPAGSMAATQRHMKVPLFQEDKKVSLASSKGSKEKVTMRESVHLSVNNKSSQLFTVAVEENLPETFDLSQVVRTESESCMLCFQMFTTKAMSKNPIKHCKRCGKSVCSTCSNIKR